MPRPAANASGSPSLLSRCAPVAAAQFSPRRPALAEPDRSRKPSPVAWRKAAHGACARVPWPPVCVRRSSIGLQKRPLRLKSRRSLASRWRRRSALLRNLLQLHTLYGSAQKRRSALNRWNPVRRLKAVSGCAERWREHVRVLRIPRVKMRPAIAIKGAVGASPSSSLIRRCYVTDVTSYTGRHRVMGDSSDPYSRSIDPLAII